MMAPPVGRAGGARLETWPHVCQGAPSGPGRDLSSEEPKWATSPWLVLRCPAAPQGNMLHPKGHFLCTHPGFCLLLSTPSAPGELDGTYSHLEGDTVLYLPLQLQTRTLALLRSWEE